MPPFVIATLAPLPLLLAGMALGGSWGWAALICLTAGVALLDVTLPEAWENRLPDSPGAEALLVALGLAHLALVALALVWLCTPGALSLPAALACAVWFGQVSHPVGHELIHRPRRALRRLGRLVYGTMLFGHHASAHPKVHHIWVASRRDPNTARLGESVWRYLPRAWVGSFREGLRAESRDLRRAGRPRWRHPYLVFLLAAAIPGLLALTLGGLRGGAIYLCLCTIAQVQILLSDYVQHYGLQRTPRADGTLHPVGLQHSWNAPQRASAALMLNAPRHSDHHVHPARHYPGLQLQGATMPTLPYSLPVMATLALVPPLWRRIMDPRVAQWRDAARIPRDAN